MKRSMFFLSCYFFLICVQALTAQIKINEVMVSNTMHYDDVVYNFSDWIELYNPGTSSVNIQKYYFTDDPAEPLKWQMTDSKSIKKGGFLIINFDKAGKKTNASFRLEPKGGTIYVYDKNRQLVDQVTYPKMNNGNVSYGRIIDGGNEWSKMAYPTPASTNSAGRPSNQQAIAPQFSEEGGFINQQKVITLSSSTPNAEIYYTLNGDEPFDNNTQITSASHMLTGNAIRYTGPITVNKSTVIRAKTYANGYLPSTVVTQSYLWKTREIDLPIFSIAINDRYKNDSRIGIWRHSSNRDMKRPVNVEFFPTQDEEANFNYQMDIEVFGASQRSKEHKQFNIIADKRYQGNNRMKYDFFNEKQGHKRKSVTLRTSGQDGSRTMMQDAFVHVVIKDQMDIDREAYQPTVVYMNGSYNGLMNIRERTQKDYLESNYGYEPHEYDLLGKHNDHSSIRAARGNMNEWNRMVNYLKSNDLKIDANYQYFISEFIDEPEVLNYFLVQTYINNSDQPNNNIKAWRPYEQRGEMKTKWRYILHDADLAIIRNSVSSDRIKSTMKSSTSSMGYIFYSLGKNETFKQKFAGQYLVHAYQTFDPFRTDVIVDSLAANIEKEIPYTHDVHSSVPTLDKWKKYIKEFRDYWGERQKYAAKHLKSAFKFKGEEMVFKINYYSTEGDIYLNSIKLLKSFNGKYLQDLSYSIKAEAKPGYTFSHWNIKSDGVYSNIYEEQYTGTIQAKAKEVIISPVYFDESGTLTTTIDEILDINEIFNPDEEQNTEVGTEEAKTANDKDVPAEEKILLYPNPTQGTLFIETNTIVNKVEIFNSSGQLIKSYINQPSPIDISFLKNDLYLVRIHTDNKVDTQLIIKE